MPSEVEEIEAIIREELDWPAERDPDGAVVASLSRIASRIAALPAQDREGAREMRERAAAAVEREAHACIADIVVGDDVGTAMACARHGAIATSAGDIQALPLSPVRSEDGHAKND